MLKKAGLSLLFFLVKLYGKTLRFETIYPENYKGRDSGNVFAIWHGHLLPLVLFYKYRNTVTIVSKSKDGDIANYFLSRLGYVTARGSSSRSGSESLMKAAALMKSNSTDAAVTVDGPKGPKFSVKPGVIYLAKKNSGVLVPAVCKVNFYKKFKSWDNFILPMPFSKIYIYFGEGISYENDSENKVSREEVDILREKMLELTRDYFEDFL
jgi:hypothetical protein